MASAASRTAHVLAVEIVARRMSPIDLVDERLRIERLEHTATLVRKPIAGGMINLGSTAGISLAMAKGMDDAAKVTGTLAELRAVARGRSYHPVIGGHCRRRGWRRDPRELSR